VPDVSVVAVCYLHPGGMKIVLVHSREHEDHVPYLKFPGGRQESNETPEATAVREVRDETGLILREEQLVRAVKLERHGRGEDYNYYIFLAVIDSLSGIKSEYTEPDGRVLVILALDLDDLDSFPMEVLPMHKPWVKELQELAVAQQS
jgi:ADP-ribose pyrophosphatase YjhB (NUDIX family)